MHVKPAVELIRKIVAFPLGIVLGFLITGTVWLLLFNLSLDIPETREDRMLVSWIRVKEGIADSIGGRKNVLLGGSGMLYGISAKQIEEVTGVPTVNMGLHAALPLYYILNKAKGALSKGDTLVLSFEWQLFGQDETNLTEVFVGYLLGNHPNAFHKLPDAVRWKIILASGASRIFLPFRFSKKESEWVQWVTDGWIRADSFNERGDYAKSDKSRKSEAQRRILSEIVPLHPGHFKINFQSRNWGRLKRFLDWCRERDIRVVYVFPPMIDFPEHRSPEARKEIEKFTKALEAEGVEILMTQEESLYPQEAFFDSFYHLTSEAREKRTRQLLDKRMLPGQ